MLDSRDSAQVSGLPGEAFYLLIISQEPVLLLQRFIYFAYTSGFCLYVCTCRCISSGCLRGQKRVLNALQLELWMVVSRLGTEVLYRATGTLNPSAIAPAPPKPFLSIDYYYFLYCPSSHIQKGLAMGCDCMEPVLLLHEH